MRCRLCDVAQLYSAELRKSGRRLSSEYIDTTLLRVSLWYITDAFFVTTIEEELTCRTVSSTVPSDVPRSVILHKQKLSRLSTWHLILLYRGIYKTPDPNATNKGRRGRVYLYSFSIPLALVTSHFIN